MVNRRHAREGGHPVISDAQMESRDRGILDRPVKPDDDGVTTRRAHNKKGRDCSRPSLSL
jgi:hypothetical protein